VKARKGKQDLAGGFGWGEVVAREEAKTRVQHDIRATFDVLPFDPAAVDESFAEVSEAERTRLARRFQERTARGDAVTTDEMETIALAAMIDQGGLLRYDPAVPHANEALQFLLAHTCGKKKFKLVQAWRKLGVPDWILQTPCGSWTRDAPPMIG
jgi:hypothetical protein